MAFSLTLIFIALLLPDWNAYTAATTLVSLTVNLKSLMLFSYDDIVACNNLYSIYFND